MAETQNPKLIETFYQFLENRKKRIMVVYGGAGSGKSVSMAQLFIRRLISENDMRMLVLRKTLPALRITAYRLILDLLKQYGIPHTLNKTEMLIVCPATGTEILFKSLDDPEKIKSYEGNYLWIEEATEVNREDFMQLNLRMRRANPYGINQLYLSFNPISAFHWIKTELIDSGRDDIATHHSTYLDNPFLSAEYKAEIEALIHQDENFWKIYGLGEFGILQNTIYHNYVVEPVSIWPPNMEDRFFGLDFGFNNETALVEVNIYDAEPYVRERLYEKGLTNADLIARLKSLDVGRDTIYCDSAEPARITEIRKSGLVAVPAKKDVKDGLDYCKRQKIHISADSSNLIDEIRGYKYKEDRDGNVQDEPVKFRDHLLDALRYALYTGMKRGSKEMLWM